MISKTEKLADIKKVDFYCAKINGSEIQRLRENKWRENWGERKFLVRESFCRGVVAQQQIPMIPSTGSLVETAKS